MKIVINNSFSEIIADSIPTEVFQFLTFSYTTKVKFRGETHPRDQEMSLTLIEGNKFPTGLVFQLEDYLKSLGYNVELQDSRIAPTTQTKIRSSFPYEPESHQTEALELSKSTDRGIVVLPTGSGKTHVAKMIIADKGVKSLFLVNGIELLNQAYEDFKKSFPYTTIGIIGKGNFKPGFITVATIQTIWSRFKTPEVKAFLKSIDLLIGDEIHHVNMSFKKPSKTNKAQPREKYPGNSLFSVIQETNSYFRYGFSAKIGAEGSIRKWLLDAAIGSPFIKKEYTELKDRGILSDLRIFVIKTPPLPRSKNYNATYRKNVQENTWVHQLTGLLCDYFLNNGRQTLVSTDRINTTNAVQKQKIVKGKITNYTEREFTEGHTPLVHQAIEAVLPGKSVMMTGEISTATRNKYLQGIRRGDIRIICGTLLKEGIDIPNLDTIIYLPGGRAETDNNLESSSTKAIQTVGRILRNPSRIPGKKRATFVDIYYDDGGGMLSRHSDERIKAYKEHGYPVYTFHSFNDEFMKKLDAWIRDGKLS